MGLFESIDRGGNGLISWEDFFESLHQSSMLSFLSKLDLDVLDVAQFFAILSDDGQCRVDLEAFVTGCIKMRGNAKSMDLLGLINQSRKEISKMNEFREQTAEDLHSILLLCEPIAEWESEEVADMTEGDIDDQSATSGGTRVPTKRLRRRSKGEAVPRVERQLTDRTRNQQETQRQRAMVENQLVKEL